MRILMPLAGGIAVVAVSGFGTLAVMRFWPASSDPAAAIIHVVSATYGGNCQDFVTPAQAPNWARPGNVTSALAAACDSAKSNCLFKIDVHKLGDPANGCGKEFVALWRCGTEQAVHEFYLPAEADKRTVLLICHGW